MSNSKLIELSYYDPSAQVRLSAYADTIVLDHDQNGSIISAIRFGGYPEMVRAMADAIYGGATIEAAQNDTTRMLQSSLKSYQRQITHDGIYAVATLMAADTVQEDDRSGKHEKDEDTNLVDTEQMELQPRRCYIFCPARDQKRLFEELDHKTAAPLIPEFQDYVLSSLRQRGDLRQLEVISLKERMDAWVLDLKPQDQNVVEVLEQGLQSGDIQIPGAVPNMPDVFENVENVTGYLNTFGVTVADRIRNQFMPLFDPAKEPLSDEVLAINDCIMSRVGYSLYDAQLAVAEAVKRQLARKRVALIIAECGSGKTKIGSTALGALHGLWADQKRKDGRKSFGIVMCPSHVTQKWVREIGETLPDTYGMVVRTIQDLNRLYAMYEKGDKSVFAVFSKEQARDGYMRYPAVRWNRRRRAFLCPDCDGVIEMEISEDGSRYTVPADQFFFQKEHKKNHTCPHCGTVQLCRAENQGRMTLRSGDACYEVDVWERGAFPKPDLPFPEDTVKLSGIPAMAQHTVFATAQDNSKPLLKCVNLMFTSTGLRAAGSNGNCIVTARGDNQSTGDVSLLIPAASLGKLSNMCQDKDEFRVGTTGKSIVFFRENFLFSARLMEGGYIDTDQLVGSIRNAFTVLTDIHDMRAALSSVLSIGTGNRVKLSFQDQRLVFQCAGDCVSASAPIEVIALTGAPAGDYWFNAKQLVTCLKALSGTVTLGIAQGGMLTLATQDAYYLQSAMRPEAQKKTQKAAQPAAAKAA